MNTQARSNEVNRFLNNLVSGIIKNYPPIVTFDFPFMEEAFRTKSWEEIFKEVQALLKEEELNLELKVYVNSNENRVHFVLKTWWEQFQDLEENKIASPKNDTGEIVRYLTNVNKNPWIKDLVERCARKSGLPIEYRPYPMPINAVDCEFKESGYIPRPWQGCIVFTGDWSSLGPKGLSEFWSEYHREMDKLYPGIRIIPLTPSSALER